MRGSIVLIIGLTASACTSEVTKDQTSTGETLSAFISFPSTKVRDCILQAANIAEELSNYDELDRDFLVAYASQLSLDDFMRQTKGQRTYSEDLEDEAVERLLREAKTNSACREA